MSRFAADLRHLNVEIREDLHLPSLRENSPRVQGYAFKFALTLPLFDADGNRVFVEEQLAYLHLFFDRRFGGCSSKVW